MCLGGGAPKPPPQPPPPPPPETTDLELGPRKKAVKRRSNSGRSSVVSPGAPGGGLSLPAP